MKVYRNVVILRFVLGLDGEHMGHELGHAPVIDRVLFLLEVPAAGSGTGLAGRSLLGPCGSGVVVIGGGSWRPERGGGGGRLGLRENAER